MNKIEKRSVLFYYMLKIIYLFVLYGYLLILKVNLNCCLYIFCLLYNKVWICDKSKFVLIDVIGVVYYCLNDIWNYVYIIGLYLVNWN